MSHHKNRRGRGRAPRPATGAQLASIDQNLAHIRTLRLSPADSAMASTDRDIAADLAADLAVLADPTGTDPAAIETCGRIIVGLSAHLGTVYREFGGNPRIEPLQLARVLINIVSLTGERMAHGVYEGGPGDGQ